jgi:Domain of unknown function (DUF4333)
VTQVPPEDSRPALVILFPGATANKDADTRIALVPAPVVKERRPLQREDVLPKPSKGRTAVSIVVIAMIGALAAGCGSSLSTSATQITSASCPGDVKKEKGKAFTCDVKLGGGGKAKVTVTQTSNHNTFSYAFKSGSVVLPGSTVDKELEQDLADAGVKDATVNCPDEVPVKPDTTVTCPITTSSGRQATVSFSFSTVSGTVDSSSVEQK